MDTEKRYFRLRDDASTDMVAHLTWNPEGNSLGDSWAAKWDCVGATWGDDKSPDVAQILEPCASDAQGAVEAKQWMQLSWDGETLEHHEADPVLPYLPRKEWDKWDEGLP